LKQEQLLKKTNRYSTKGSLVVRTCQDQTPEDRRMQVQMYITKQTIKHNPASF